MADDSQPQRPRLQVNLPPEQEVGLFADFVSVWHTPTTFVLDFVTIKQPAHPTGDDGQTVLEARVASRVRIPSEQIFPLIHALTEQGNRWLKETGRSEPPAQWLS